MNQDREIAFVRERLRTALAPIRERHLEADLWPRLLRRMDEPGIRFGWFESMLTGSVGLALVFFPELLPALLYHL